MLTQVVVQGPAELPPLPQMPVLPPWMTLPPWVTALIVLGFFAASATVLYPLMRAIGRRLEGKSSSPDPALREEIDRLTLRLGEMDALQHHVAELEERLDFAERILAQRREPDRLGGGQT
jgi:hypothetical protein